MLLNTMSSFFQDGLLFPLVFIFSFVIFKACFNCSSPQVEINHSRVVLPNTGCRFKCRALQEAHSCGSALEMCCSAAKQERVLTPRKSSSQERDKDQMGKWHCQDTQSREEEESIAGGSKARNVSMEHGPVLVDQPLQTFLCRA